MLLVDSNIEIKPDVFKSIIAEYIKQGTIPVNSIYTINTFNNNSISRYYQRNFLTSKKQEKLKVDIRDNLALIEELLPLGWKLNRDFGFICEIVPNDNYRAFDL